MNQTLYKSILFCTFLLLFQSCFYRINCQTETSTDAAKKYDEILNKDESEKAQPSATPSSENQVESQPQIETQTEQPKEVISEKEVQGINELTNILPKLDNTLYKDWSKSGEPVIWIGGESSTPPVSQKNELLSELGIESILKQSYKKENHAVEIVIYKFRDFAGAYSAYSILHQGATTKLKVGKNASESESLINFWKESYYVDIHTNEQNDTISKEFIILSGQDVSKNIEKEQLPPVVAIQLPALYKAQGTERFCLGPVCCNDYIKKESFGLDCNLLNLQNSGGVITAEYQLSDDSKDKERITLILVRYTGKDIAESVFNIFKSDFESKQKEKKDMDIEVEDSLVKVKNNKNNYTMLKQKGNLLAIAYNITNKKSGEQVLGLVPWPIEIYKGTQGNVPSNVPSDVPEEKSNPSESQ